MSKISILRGVLHSLAHDVVRNNEAMDDTVYRASLSWRSQESHITMNESLSVGLFMCVLSALFIIRLIIGHWLGNRACRKLFYDLKNVDCGLCPKCHMVHPEAVKRSGFQGFWVEFKCPSCCYDVKIHLDAQRPEDM